jgi:hypothetical protein
MDNQQKNIKENGTMKKTPSDKLTKWIEEARKAMEENTKKEFPTCEVNWCTLGADFGPSYIRVWRDSLKYSGHKSAYCFLDYQGNIFKASSWKSPAKGIRGTIETKDPHSIGGSSSWLYR